MNGVILIPVYLTKGWRNKTYNKLQKHVGCFAFYFLLLM